MATKLTYKEQLLHPNWQRKRLEMLEAAGWKCVSCEAADQTLHVHHKRYIKGRKAWEYENDELEVLCEGCHEQEHNHRELLDRLLAESNDGWGIASVIGLLAGYLHGNCSIGDELANAAISADGYSYDLGVMASVAGGADWPVMAAAARSMSRSFTPQQEAVLARWEDKETEKP